MSNELEQDIAAFASRGAVAAGAARGPFTLAEKIAVLDNLIEEFRWARSKPEIPEHVTYSTLKAISADMRARLGSAPSVAEHEIGRRITAVRQAKTINGNLTGAIMALGQEVHARWPLVQQALNRFGALTEVDR